MRNFLTIWRRELAACFLSPIAYVTMVVFLGASAFTFVVGVLRNTGQTAPVSTLLFGAIVVWLALLITVITMRLFAEEKRSGTIETLMTAPVTEAEVVLGKYAGALTFLLVVLLPSVASLFVLVWFSPGLSAADVDTGALLGGLLIIGLLSAFFTAMGLFISLMTRNQIVSAISTLTAVWLGLLLGWLLSGVPGLKGPFADALAATTHIEDFCRGIVDARPVVLYVSGTWFLLFASVCVLESRRWR